MVIFCKTAWRLPVVLLVLAMQPAMAAQRLTPPVEALLDNPEHTRIVVATAREKIAPNRIHFSVSERLSGDSPDEVVLRTDAMTYADAPVGSEYVVAWTYLRRNRGVIGGWEQDPAGPSIVPILGLGSAALFEHTPQMSLLFSPRADTGAPATARQLDAVLEQMQRTDARSRGLVILELYLRPDLSDLVTPSQAAVLKQVIQAGDDDLQHVDFLLRAALRLPRDTTSPWLAETFRRIIMKHGSQYDLSSLVPALVRTAAQGLQQSGTKDDLQLLGPLLYSNNPGVAKAALAAMDHLDHASTVSIAEKAMKNVSLHSETRLAVERYLGQTGMQGGNGQAKRW